MSTANRPGDRVPLVGVIDKVRNSTLSTASATILIAIAARSGYPLDPELAAAIVLVAGTATSYLTSLKWREIR